ncbi:MAG: hypothetical protein ACRYFB_03710 [Janthinobacterium lividum]
MKNLVNDFLGIELKQHYFEEFKLCGIPVPVYSNTAGFILKFKSVESYLNYINVLKLILTAMKLADPENHKYEIQRSKSFIINLLEIMRKQFAEKYN